MVPTRFVPMKEREPARPTGFRSAYRTMTYSTKRPHRAPVLSHSAELMSENNRGLDYQPYPCPIICVRHHSRRTEGGVRHLGRGTVARNLLWRSSKRQVRQKRQKSLGYARGRLCYSVPSGRSGRQLCVSVTLSPFPNERDGATGSLDHE
jgi:hypothetical protein